MSSTKALYHASNTNPTDTDGWKRSNPSGSWVAMTGLAQYNANNTTADESDGVRIGASVWNPISKATYDGGNTTNDDTDGYRRVSNGSFSGSISKATYDANNTTQDSSDGFRRINPSGAWVSITEAEYNARNTTSDESDGVRPGPDVVSPSGHRTSTAQITQTKRNAGILARLISGNFNGEPWTGALEHQRAGGEHVRRAQLDKCARGAQGGRARRVWRHVDAADQGRQHIRDRRVRVSEHGDH